MAIRKQDLQRISVLDLSGRVVVFQDVSDNSRQTGIIDIIKPSFGSIGSYKWSSGKNTVRIPVYRNR
jgi:hypothetical protein